MGKRLFDVLVAGIGLTLAAPIFIVLGILIWLIEGRPVLFRQMRPGLGGRLFTIYKFRTMRHSEPGATDGTRLTRLGRWLREGSLDELPELWNVLRGDMSMVGPRPLLSQYLPLYSPEQMRRHEVRPGLTGWAQVNGRNAVDWDERFKLDVWYVNNRTLWLDIRILLRTVAIVLARRGISRQGHATMPEFGRTERPTNDEISELTHGA